MKQFVTTLGLISLILACTTTPTNEDRLTPNLSGPAPCSKPFDDANIVPLGDPRQDQGVVLYQEICNGGLYLMNRSSREPLLKINEDWWLESIQETAWDAASGSGRVTASFITGIGPTGTVPFTKQFHLAPNPTGGWQAVALEQDPSQPVALEPGLYEITNQVQLDALQLSSANQKVDLPVDFSIHRLIIKSVWLTSGSTKIVDIRVAQNNRAYFITYGTKSPRIGTTDMKHVVIYAVLPRDHRYVSFEEPEYGSRNIRVQSGVLEHATFQGMAEL